MYGRKVNAPYGSLCDISSFSHSDASKEIIVFSFASLKMNAPLWDFACMHPKLTVAPVGRPALLIFIDHGVWCVTLSSSVGLDKKRCC